MIGGWKRDEFTLKLMNWLLFNMNYCIIDN